MNYNENSRNRSEKKEKKKVVNIQNDLYLGNQNPYHAENGIKWLLGQNYAVVYGNIRNIRFFALRLLTKPFKFKGKLGKSLGGIHRKSYVS